MKFSNINILLFIFSLCFVQNINGQEDFLYNSNPKKWGVKVDLLSPLLLRLPTLNFVADYKIRPDVSIHAGYGIRLNGLQEQAYFGENQKYHRFFFGGHYAFKHRSMGLWRFINPIFLIRFRPPDNDRIVHRLLGLRVTYLPISYERSATWLIRDGEQFDFDFSNVKLDRLLVELLIGRRFIDNKNFYVDYITAIGFSRNYVSHRTNIETLAPFERFEEGFFAQDRVDRKVGINHRLVITLGLEIGFGIFE